VDLSVEEVETELVDLSDVSLSTLRRFDRSSLIQSRQRMLAQIDGVRSNIGSSGPPGRAD
jgi:hypothetical protein